jgi:hypothetical protein
VTRWLLHLPPSVEARPRRILMLASNNILSVRRPPGHRRRRRTADHRSASPPRSRESSAKAAPLPSIAEAILDHDQHLNAKVRIRLSDVVSQRG